MKKIALIAALPFALGLAACDSSPDTAADGDATAMDAEGDMTTTDTSVVAPQDTSGTAAAGTGTGETNAQAIERLDETAEDLEERADRIEDTNEAEADRLEARAKTLQNERDARD